MARRNLPAGRRRTTTEVSRRPARLRPFARRPAIEALEGRALMSVGGGADFSFGTYGTVGTGFPSRTTFTSTASVLESNGSLVVVGKESYDTDVSGGTPSNPTTVPVAINSTFSARRYNPDGSLDDTFYNQSLFGIGDVSSPVSKTIVLSPPVYTGATGVALQSDGKILVVGDVNNTALLIRLNSNGSIDSSFGTNGVVTLGAETGETGILDYASAVATLPDGDIAVAGESVAKLGPAVEVLSSTGRVVTSFGTGGLAVAPVPANASAFVQVIPAIDGGNDTYTTASPVTMAVEPDGSIIVTGNAILKGVLSSEIVAARFTPAGAVDTRFGTGGDATITAQSIFPGTTVLSGTAIALQPDGKIVIGGGIAAPGDLSRMLAVRFDANGQLDTSFGVDGADITSVAHPIEGSYAGAIAIQPDGKIILADAWTSDFVRLDTDGLPDPTFGIQGTSVDDQAVLLREPIPAVIVAGQSPSYGPGAAGIAITPTGKILVAQSAGGGLARLIENGASNDFDEDGYTDETIDIVSTGGFGYLASGGVGASQFFPLGNGGRFGDILPAPGAYDGFGIDEPAVYDAVHGEFIIKTYASPNFPSTTEVIHFGLPDGETLPAPGDYTGSGTTELGVYDPTTGIYAYRPLSGSPDVYVKIGGSDPSSIPVPGDYFGTGQDDVAIYEPTSATFLIQDPTDGQIVSIPFGIPGLGNTVPVPGDYDGSGRTELAVYLPNLAEFIYRPTKGGGADVTVPFGIPGIGAMLPAPGDYDGSGQTEVGGYLEGSGIYAYRPADGSPDVYEKIGAPIETLPYNLASATDATVLVPRAADPVSGPVSAEVEAAGSADVPLTPDVLDTLAGTVAKKKTGPA